jgi:Cellulase (glycosyl hydrolase family 5)
VVNRRTALKVPLLLAVGTALAHMPRASAEEARWSADRVNRWYQAQGWLVGANFITSTAINQLEMFQADTYDPRRIDGDLGVARLHGVNAVRVFLHDQLWAQDRQGFQGRLAQFVGIAARHGIKPLFVLFDSCWDPLPKSGRQRAPRPGVHNSGWVQSPGAERVDDRVYRAVLQDYVTGVLSQFRSDDRVLGWDLWNEPDNPAKVYRRVERKDKIERVTELLPQVFQWARSVNPGQPLTSGVWDGPWGDPGSRSDIASIQLNNSDVVTFHSYAAPGEFESRIDELAPLGRPIMCTEYMARSQGSTVEGILPVAKRRNVGAFNWGLVAGKTQTYFPWDSWDHPYPTPPKVWFHDLLLPDGRPYRDSEMQTMRSLTGRALFAQGQGAAGVR